MTHAKLKKLIRYFLGSFNDDDSETAATRHDETLPAIREVQECAIDLGLPRVAEVCASVKTRFLALSTARIVLSECLSLLETPGVTDGMLSLREAARRLGYTESGLRKIVARKGIEFFQAKRWGPIKFKPEWLESFVDRHTAQKKRPAKSRPSSKPITFDEF